MELIRATLQNALRVHPRVLQQGILTSPEVHAQLVAALPPILPFGGRKPVGVVAILDWDHRLPSHLLILRVHLLYSAESKRLLEQALGERAAEIARRDLYPEFDVADYDGLLGDETYEAELTPELELRSVRLSSPWRRDIDFELASAAVERVRASSAFEEVRTTQPSRPPHLGDLEPVSWMPPCESGHSDWTIDVWWLTAFDGRVGRGWSFLVDVKAPQPIVAHREFSVRAG